MSDLEQLARDGGARWVLALAREYARLSGRTNGGEAPFPLELERFLTRLAELDTGDISSDSETTSVTVVNVIGMVPVAAAAAEVGCSEVWVRKLARKGRIRSHRAGPRCQLVDLEGLRRALTTKENAL